MSRSLAATEALPLGHSSNLSGARPITALLSARVLLALACLFMLAPFLSKPFHIDDPMYLWAAQHILHHPLDPYGFSVNWNRTLLPMVAEMKNPPLVCYYLAGVMLLLGKSEAVVHLAMILPALGVVLGVYQLAKELCDRPALAAAVTLLAPGFLVSSSTVMCDVMMLCGYVWAIWFWMRGLKEPGRMWMLIVASVLIAASTLTKYFGVSLFPLLIVYGFFVKRRPGIWLVPLIIPAGILLAYQMITQHLYGRGLLLDAAGYATQSRWGDHAKIISAMTAGLTFTGGCCASILLLALAAMRRRFWLIVPLAVAAIILMLLLALDPIAQYSVYTDNGTPRWGMLIQIGIWSACGSGILMMALLELWRRREAESVLLACWIGGTFCFGVFVNWNVTARSIIPMIPAGAIIAVRWWERRERRRDEALVTPPSRWRACKPFAIIAPAGALAILLVAADTSLARCARDAADAVSAAVGKDFSGRLAFCGHWGFHEYMQRIGAEPIDVMRTALEPGDIFVQPDDNTSVVRINPTASRVLATLEFQPMTFVSTMQPDLRAGFYSNTWGPLPFAFGPVPPEAYRIYTITQPMTAMPTQPTK